MSAGPQARRATNSASITFVRWANLTRMKWAECWAGQPVLSPLTLRRVVIMLKVTKKFGIFVILGQYDFKFSL